MNRQPVASASITSVGHDPETGELQVEFAGGSVYSYSNVPREDFEALLAAKSIGAHFARSIKSKNYAFTKVARDPHE